MDWTAIGAPPPTATSPILISLVFRRLNEILELTGLGQSEVREDIVELFPEKKTLPAVGKVSGDIIQDQKGQQEDEYSKSDLHHDILDLGTEISPEHSFQTQNENLSSVEYRNRE